MPPRRDHYTSVSDRAKEPGRAESVDDVGLLIAEPNEDRIELTLTNHGAQDAYVQLCDAADVAPASAGNVIKAEGGSFYTCRYSGPVTVICASGESTVVGITEV